MPDSILNPCDTPPFQIPALMLGYGYWGRNVAKAIRQNPYFRLHGIFDSDTMQIQNALRDHPFIQTYERLEEALNDPSTQAIFIITPPQTHYSLAKKALQRGRHIFVEKPLCMRKEEALELFELAQENRLQIHCDHIFLYAPAVRYLKQHLHTLGDIVYINARRINLGLFQNNVDVIWDLAIHDLSIIDYLIGLDILNIQSFTRKYQNHPNDAIANINLELKNHIIITINVSWLSPIKVREMILGGEKKSAIYDETKSQKLAIFDSGVVIKDRLSPHSLYAKMVEYKLGETHYPKLESTLALDNSIRAFGNKIFTRHPCQAHKNHVIKIISILQTIAKCK